MFTVVKWLATGACGDKSLNILQKPHHVRRVLITAYIGNSFLGVVFFAKIGNRWMAITWLCIGLPTSNIASVYSIRRNVKGNQLNSRVYLLFT